MNGLDIEPTRATTTSIWNRTRSRVRKIDFKGELFSSSFTFGISATIRLVSAVVLTRLLNPEAYGIVAILYSVAYIVELISDVGTVTLLVRHRHGGDPKFIHTLWTVRLIRSCVNFALLYGFAPLIAKVYEAPLLTDALRLYSYTFLLAGLQSMAFILAQRDQRSRIVNYVELATNFVMTITVIVLATILKDHYAFIYGILVQRLLVTLSSFLYYREIGVAIAFDREALVEQLQFSKIVLPSSLITILLTQYDKIVLLKLFDLGSLGVYGVATSLIAPIGALIGRNANTVLYPRCAEYFRGSRELVIFRYYRENRRLLMFGTFLPAAIAGLAYLIVAILYDTRYAGAGLTVSVLGLIAVLSSFEQPSENLLVAAGQTRIILAVNILRLMTLPTASLAGYYIWGFPGFLGGMLVAPIFVVIYLLRQQMKLGLLNRQAEVLRFVQATGLFAICLLISQLFLHIVPMGFLPHFASRH